MPILEYYNLYEVEISTSILTFIIEKIIQVVSNFDKILKIDSNLLLLELELNSIESHIKGQLKNRPEYENIYNDIQKLKKSLKQHKLPKPATKEVVEHACINTIPPPPPLPMPPQSNKIQNTRKNQPNIQSLGKGIPSSVVSARMNAQMTTNMQQEIKLGKQRLKSVPVFRTPSGTPKNQPLPTILTGNDYLLNELRKKFAFNYEN